MKMHISGISNDIYWHINYHFMSTIYLKINLGEIYKQGIIQFW